MLEKGAVVTCKLLSVTISYHSSIIVDQGLWWMGFWSQRSLGTLPPGAILSNSCVNLAPQPEDYPS